MHLFADKVEIVDRPDVGKRPNLRAATVDMIDHWLKRVCSSMAKARSTSSKGI